MNEYDVKKALSKRSGQSNNAPAASQSVNGIPNSVLTDVFAGKRSATSDMMGHREELAPSIAAKMSQSFGMDFSAVKVYRSDAMAGTEMHGMAQGDRVVLSSDVDLNTMEGQATLGHELSHIRAQSMGMGSGRGLLNDASLEHQADSEGMLAARGMNISGESMGMSMGLGMAGVEGLSPIGAGLGASAAAPMQASKGREDAPEPESEPIPEMTDKGMQQTADRLMTLGQDNIKLHGGTQEHLELFRDRKGNLANIVTAQHAKEFEEAFPSHRRELARYYMAKRQNARLALLRKHRVLMAQAPAEFSEEQKRDYADYLLRRNTEETDVISGLQDYLNNVRGSFEETEEYDEKMGHKDYADEDLVGKPYFDELQKVGTGYEKKYAKSSRELDRLSVIALSAEKTLDIVRNKYAKLMKVDPKVLKQEEKAIDLRKANEAAERLRLKEDDDDDWAIPEFSGSPSKKAPTPFIRKQWWEE